MSAYKGRFELSDENFKNFRDEKGKDFQVLDLKPLFPDLLKNAERAPRRLEEIWRKAADACLAIDKGVYYYQAKDYLVHFTFEESSGALAKAKIDVIGEYIKKSYDECIIKEDGSFELASPPPGAKAEKASEGDENLRKVLEKGLTKNPSIKEIKIWAGRALQNLHLSQSIPSELVKLLEDYKFCYVPFWNAENGVLVGACCELNPRGTHAADEGQIIRDNIAQVGGTRQELGRLLANNTQAVVVVPIYIKTLIEKDATEFILALLNKTPEPVRKCMIFELRGLGKNLIPAAAKGALYTISLLSRSLIIDTGILTQPDMSNEPFKIHAYGCNYNDVNLPEDQRLTLMKKYAATCTQKGMKAYIRNVPNIETVKKAYEFGFTYINAPTVIKPKLSCPKAARMSLEDAIALP